MGLEIWAFKMVVIQVAVAMFAIISSCTVHSTGNAHSEMENLRSEQTTIRQQLDALNQSLASCKNEAATASVAPRKQVHFFATLPRMVTGKVDRIKYSTVRVNVGRAFNKKTGTFRAPVNGFYQFYFSSQNGRGGGKTDLWLVVNGYWVSVSHTDVTSPSTVGSLNTYMTYLRRGSLVYVTQNCGSSWANAISSTIIFGGSLLAQTWW